ncbi:hypothetical protein SI65_07270 [Aspergillus cristatus]|uniref:Uncharacterized protein n=1 Tax=Aspergillus cristatus TaxID=573508 RepID=A0A1E3B9F6_ASPCR|nr:hypothetical protein SI65_07270 [Aspergillus cristatus]
MSFEFASSQLQNMGSIEDPRAMIRLAVSSTMEAYETTEATREFDIRHLGEEAMKRIKCLSDAVHIYQILDIAQEVWHILSADPEYWIYLETMIVAASHFHENLFMTEPFLNHFEPSPEADNGFGKFLAAVMARAHYRQLSLASGEQVEQIAFPICPCKRHAGNQD